VLVLVAVIVAVRNAAACEQVIIDYGYQYFWYRQCLCGSLRCKYPDKVNLGVSTKPIKPAKPKGTSELSEKDRPMRYNSVLDSDDEMDMI
jgi:hypothetical protein